ncbi:MAG TPA: MGMT family protein [Steroidobacteraceae bacterium]|nr:MGMT family protein [Steroidobacteraceae bacterium]
MPPPKSGFRVKSGFHLPSGRGTPRERPGGESDAVAAIWQVVAAIPRGRVSTYGEVARAAGLPRRARLAGFALRMAPPELHLPWHRVVGAGGKISFPASSAHHREQARRLRGEGVGVRAGRVDRAALLEAASL